MNLLKQWNNWRREQPRPRSRQTAVTPRRGRFEQLEERRLLHADPLFIGAVYIEEDLGSDVHGDTFEVTFAGGAAGTELTRIEIDGDQVGNFGNDAGFSSGDVFFDTVNSRPTADNPGLGADDAFGLQLGPILRPDGQIRDGSSVSGAVIDGGSLLVLDFVGFQQGDTFRFAIDVDEVEIFDPRVTDIDQINDGFDPLTSGAEFHGSLLTAHVTAPHFHDAIGVATFANRYDGDLQVASDTLGGRLDLPGDDQNQNRDRTAGAVVALQQIPQPITIAGTAYHDRNLNLVQDVQQGESGIEGVEIALWAQNEDGSYAAAETESGRRVVTRTDSHGDYAFDTSWNLLPGVYQIRETQPDDFAISVGAVTGRVAGVPSGEVHSDNRLTNIVIADGGVAAVDYDFAEARPAGVSGRVFHDRNDNGIFEPDETAIPNVVVQLVDEQGGVLSSETNQAGYYEFSNLRPGEYRIEELQPVGWIDGRDSLGEVRRAAGAAPSGSAGESDAFGAIRLLSEDVGVNYDFGELLGSIEGVVHHDLNGDCVLNQNEAGIGGVTVTLTAEDGSSRTTQTDSNGRYRFEDLYAGVYSVRETQPVEFFSGGQQAGTGGGDASLADTISNVLIGGGQRNLGDYNFCEHLGEIGGYVYYDRNDNGLREPDEEEAIAGVTIRLVDAHGTERTTSTDAQGHYAFANLSPGDYQLLEVQPAGWLDGRDTAGAFGGRTVGRAENDRLFEIRRASFDEATRGVNYNFGERLGSLAGSVFADQDDDCEFDAGESGIAGVTMTLVDQDGLQRTTQTDGDGRYAFLDLPEGQYTVIETQPGDFFHGGQQVGTGVGDATAADTISGVRIGGGDVHLRDYDFCEHRGAISGYVYHDRNDNGLREPDAGEEAIAGATVRLLDDAGGERSATTDARGFYQFLDIGPGRYEIVESQPIAWVDGKDAAGTFGDVALGAAENDRLVGVNLTPELLQTAGVNYNFGERLGSIAGLVHLDADGDCRRDDGEQGLQGVAVHLLDQSGALLNSTLTDQAGHYRFADLQVGEYIIVEQQPSEWLHGGQIAGSHGGDDSHPDVISGASIGPGVHLVDYNFCEQPTATLSGYVFQDGPAIVTQDGLPPDDLRSHRDGSLTPDDRRLSGVQVELRDGLTGEVITSDQALAGVYSFGAIQTTTDSQGYFEFTGLRGGRSYAIFEIQPDGYIDGLDTAGTTSGLALNKQDQISPLLLATLTVDAGNDAIIRIPLAIGADSQNNNFSEVLVVAEPPRLPPPPLPPPEQPPRLQPPPSAPRLSTPPLPIVAPPSVDFEIPLYGISGLMEYTWHLSVIDAGSPRDDVADYESNSWMVVSFLDRANWTATPISNARWWQAGDHPEGPAIGEPIFGMPGAIPVTGDFNGDGVDEVGIFYQGEWFLDLNGDGRWDDLDLWARLGDQDDLPVTGDWDGDGKDDIGVFGPIWPGDLRAIEAEPGLPDADNVARIKPKNIPPAAPEATDGQRLLQRTSNGRTRADLIDHVFRYGAAQDKPVSGDWNGDGVSSIGVFRNGQWRLDANADGRWRAGEDVQVQFGGDGDLPVVGDFDGDGVANIGVFRPGGDGRASVWMLDINQNRELDAHDKVFEMGGAGDYPVVGDWDGDGVDEVGLYRLGDASGRQAQR